MTDDVLHGVVFAPRRHIVGEQGDVRHILKSTDPEFGDELPFGEAYASTIHPGVVKGWKLHTKSTTRVVVLEGEVVFVMQDRRADSPTFQQMQEVVLGTDHYGLLVIPPNIAYAWKNRSDKTSLVINVSTLAHDPEEATQISLTDIPYSW